MVFAMSYGPLAATAGVRDGTMAPRSWSFDPFSMGGRKPFHFSHFPLHSRFMISGPGVSLSSADQTKALDDPCLERITVVSSAHFSSRS